MVVGRSAVGSGQLEDVGEGSSSGSSSSSRERDLRRRELCGREEFMPCGGFGFGWW